MTRVSTALDGVREVIEVRRRRRKHRVGLRLRCPRQCSNRTRASHAMTSESGTRFGHVQGECAHIDSSLCTLRLSKHFSACHGSKVVYRLCLLSTTTWNLKLYKISTFCFPFILYTTSLINRYNRANKIPSLSIRESSSQ